MTTTIPNNVAGKTDVNNGTDVPASLTTHYHNKGILATVSGISHDQAASLFGIGEPETAILPGANADTLPMGQRKFGRFACNKKQNDGNTVFDLSSVTEGNYSISPNEKMLVTKTEREICLWQIADTSSSPVTLRLISNHNYSGKIREIQWDGDTTVRLHTEAYLTTVINGRNISNEWEPRKLTSPPNPPALGEKSA